MSGTSLKLGYQDFRRLQAIEGGRVGRAEEIDKVEG